MTVGDFYTSVVAIKSTVCCCSLPSYRLHHPIKSHLLFVGLLRLNFKSVCYFRTLASPSAAGCSLLGSTLACGKQSAAAHTPGAGPDTHTLTWFVGGAVRSIGYMLVFCTCFLCPYRLVPAGRRSGRFATAAAENEVRELCHLHVATRCDLMLATSADCKQLLSSVAV
jgi:hypothetical protein